jgi:hypothetical protein
MTSIDAGRARTSAPAARTRAERGGEPEVLTWPGEPPSWSRQHATATGVGSVAGLAVGVGAAIGGVALLAKFGKVTRWPVVGALTGAAAIGVGAGFGVAALMQQVVEDVNRVPARPDASQVPALPKAAAPPPVPGDVVPKGTKVGDGDGSYDETRQVSSTTYDSDGNPHTTYTTQHYTEYFDWDLELEQPIGRRDGYGSVREALADVPYGDAEVLRSQGGRIVAYDTSSGSHWSDLDSLHIDDPAIQAVVSPSGRVWRRNFVGAWERAETIERPKPSDLIDQRVGEYALRYQMNANVTAGKAESGRSGYPDLAHALGDMRARAGDQLVTRTGDRYHVLDADAQRVERSSNNDGFLVDGEGDQVVAIEQQGGVWSPAGDWYVAPRTAD